MNTAPDNDASAFERWLDVRAAIVAMDLAGVDRYLAGGHDLAPDTVDEGLMALAARQGATHGHEVAAAMVDRLLAAGVPLGNGRGGALQSAVERNDARMTRHLLAAGADPHRTASKLYRTLLHYAGQQTSPEGQAVARALVTAGLSPAMAWSNHKTPLHFAALANDPASIVLFLAHGAGVNAQDREGLTPLHEVIANGHAQALVVAGLLIEAGADVHRADYEGMTPLHRLVDRGGTGEMFDLLIGYGARVDATNHTNRSVLDLMQEAPERWAAERMRVERRTLLDAVDATVSTAGAPVPARARSRL